MFRPMLVGMGLYAWVAAPGAYALTLDQAVDRVLSAHPDIERRAADAAAAADEGEAAAQAPPLVVSAETEGALGADGVSGSEALEGTLRLARVLERGGKQQLRQAAGQARVSRALLERHLQRLELLAETTRRFTAVAVAQAETDLAADGLALARDLAERVTRQVEAARRSEAEAHSARMAVGRARLEQIRSAGALEAAHVRLAALWGSASPEFERAEAELFELPSLPPPAEALESLADNPDLLRLTAERRIAEAEAALARGHRQADVTVSAGAKYFGELDAGGIVLGISMPIGSRTRAEPAVRAAEHRSRAYELAVDGQRRQLQGLVSALLAQLHAGRTELTVLREAVIPEAERAVALYRDGFEAGRHSFITVAEAQRQLFEARSEAIATASQYHQLMIELESLTRNPEGATR